MHPPTYLQTLPADLLRLEAGGFEYKILQAQLRWEPFFENHRYVVFSGLVCIPFLNTLIPFSMDIGGSRSDVERIVKMRTPPDFVEKPDFDHPPTLYARKGHLETSSGGGTRAAVLDRQLFLNALFEMLPDALERWKRPIHLVRNWVEREVACAGLGGRRVVIEGVIISAEDTEWTRCTPDACVTIHDTRPQEVDAPVPPSAVTENSVSYIFD